jgi:hypothetical protein
VNAGPTLLRSRPRRGDSRRPRRLPESPARHLLLASVGIIALLFAPGAGSVPGDPTPPVVTPLFSPSLPANGWFRGTVTLNWSIVDPESIILNTSGCGAKTFTTDTPGEKVTCSAQSDGGERSAAVTVRLDKTAPTVTAAAERAPNASGWYTGPFSVSFSGTDVTSGIAGCSSGRYSGPDNAAASVAGFCSDVAGNVTGSAFSFKYDATPPILTAVTKKLGKRSVQLAWRPSSDTRLVEILRAPGRNGEGQTVVYRGSATTFRDTGLVVARKYRYRVAGLDEAENRFEHTLDITATGALLSPAPGTQVTNPPNLVWTPVKGASYYNVQLIRGRKVLSAWPVRARFQLRRTWRYNGRRHRLRPGVYRWYVWPGYGRISAARYGRLIGGSTFVVSN